MIVNRKGVKPVHVNWSRRVLSSRDYLFFIFSKKKLSIYFLNHINIIIVIIKQENCRYKSFKTWIVIAKFRNNGNPGDRFIIIFYYLNDNL